MRKFVFALATIILVSCGEKKDKSTATVDTSFSTEGKKVVVFTTADSSNYRLSVTDTVEFKEMGQPLETQVCVFVDPAKTFQTFFGIGAAMTDASAETFYKLPKEQQQELLKAYFNKETGIGYTVARTNINSCDFSSDMYTYVKDGDKELKTFNIEHDKKYKIPL